MAEYIKVYYKKFWEHAKVPDRATPFSAGSDLYSAFEYCIPREGQTAIDTGIGTVILRGARSQTSNSWSFLYLL